MRVLVTIILGGLALGSCAGSTAGDSTSQTADSTGSSEVSAEPGDVDPGAGADADTAESGADVPGDDTGAEDVAAAGDTGPDGCKDAETGDRCESDGDPCTVEVCADGECILTNGLESCADEAAQEPCWTFKCTAGVGCSKSVFASGIACDDANACTVDDRCRAGVKACLGDGIPADDGNPCTADTCVEGQVSHSPLEGTSCALGADAGVCKAGKCTPDGCTAVDGGWSAWVWGPCSVSCGGGTRSGSRTCTAPAPSCGGADCDGESTTDEPCNPDECGPLVEVTTCPAGLPFGPNPTCLSGPATTPFAKIVSSSKVADSYGVKLVPGPNGSVAALYAEQEWFERRAEDGTLLVAPVSLPALNPDIAPAQLGDLGFPAFYGPALGFDGTSFVVARSAQLTPDVHVFAIDPSGVLAVGPVTLDGPDGALAGDQGPALAWTGDGWLVAWRVYVEETGGALMVARLDPELDPDPAFGDGGLLLLEGAERHPEIAVSGDGKTAAIVTGEVDFQLSVLSAVTGDLIARTPGTCPGGSPGTNGDGNDVVWNDALGEFGVLHSTQGAGNCDGTNTSANATILRVSVDGTWIGSPLPVLCGYPIGAGFRGGIAAWPDGRYAVAMQRYHTKPYCVDPFPNGTQGTASFDLVAVDAVSGTTSLHRTHAGVPSTYSQTDVVWTGTRMVAMTPKGITQASAGYVFEP